MCVIKEALSLIENRYLNRKDKLNQSELVKKYCRLLLAEEKEEVFSVLFLDNHFNLIAVEKMFRGSINEANIYLRPIVRKIIEYNSPKIIFTHNHPSGNFEPSKNDIDITNEFYCFLKKIDCQVIDHIVVSEIGAMSFSEKGMI